MLTLMLTGMLMSAFDVQLAKASEIIYIRADGRIDPSTAPISSIDNLTYTFTAKIYYSIVVERDNIVIDGAGYTLQGTGVYASEGIAVYYRSNVTIKNAQIKGFYYGIYLYKSSNVSIYKNTITESNWDAIMLEDSSNNEITANNVEDNSDGIWLLESSNNTISGNRIIRNENQYGVKLEDSERNSLLVNRITQNHYGIWICDSSSNNVYRNEITDNYLGIYLGGEFVDTVQYNMIFENNIASNDEGLSLNYAYYNAIYGNNITSNKKCGIDFIWDSSDNKIYHNNFIGNAQQLGEGSCYHNVWDDGYPSGGNYWSDYSGIDEKSGPGQDQPGSDGIGDTPYVIDGNNRDRYPIMRQGSHSALPIDPTFFYALIVAIIAIVAAVTLFMIRKKKKSPKEATPL